MQPCQQQFSLKGEIHMMKNVLAGLLGVMLSSSIAFATPITGSASVGAASATLTGGSNLLTATSVTPESEFIGKGLVDYSPIVPFTLITNLGLNLADILAYTWSSADGSWTTSSFTILTHTASNLDLFLIGNFTPSGVLAGLDASGASEHISINQTGDSVSWAATLNSPALAPPAAVPEPGTMMLLGAGLFGLAIFCKRGKAQGNSCIA
jgi:hypothetical protein